ncbi:hypothetical protein [Glaciibacter psychrotolerans]|uniref:Uncharacterized protein n=1 Tax=Glaciibacter psychrotolerans TaxID=670054 RepID=A0A7Z0EFZ6_9MICO|nr:hypothetical protein [Leifsonia psychrotolerans]NYJ20835.1 hypothetical protein [Leifsonia psychrotolerans]
MPTRASAPAPSDEVRPDEVRFDEVRPGDARFGDTAGHDTVGHDTAGYDGDMDRVVGPRANPYLTALWLIGTLLVVAGGGLYWQSVSDDGQSYSSSDPGMPLSLILMRLSWMVAPALFSTGLLVLVALVFERAISWQRARR